MTVRKRQIPILAAVLVLLAAAACSPPGGDETAAASATPVAPDQSPGTCGDGACDEAEQSDPSLCPQDCEAAGSGGRCGDGLCDEAEQSDPALCPADCADTGGGPGEVTDENQPEPAGETKPEVAEELESEPAEETESEPADESESEPAEESKPEPAEESEPEPAEESEPTAAEGTETKCEPSEWTLAIEARSTLVNAEPSADLFAVIIGGLVVNESCRIRGTSAGQYLQETCAYKPMTGACSYHIQCPEFSAAVSGWAVPGEGDTYTFNISLDRVDIFETGWADCIDGRKEINTGPVLQNAIGSAERNGGGYLAQIEVMYAENDARPFYEEFHNAKQGQDAVVPVNLWYFFSVRLYPGTRSIRFEQLWRDWEDQPDIWDLPHRPSG
jgi:hypothetical protein